MASPPDNKIDPDVFLKRQMPRTPPQLLASTPIDNGSNDDKNFDKEVAVAKPSSDMTKSLFDYESAKSEEGFDCASMNVEPMAARTLEHKAVQCDPPAEEIKAGEDLQPKEPTQLINSPPEYF